jgi:hypothetical protein
MFATAARSLSTALSNKGGFCGTQISGHSQIEFSLAHCKVSDIIIRGGNGVEVINCCHKEHPIVFTRSILFLHVTIPTKTWAIIRTSNSLRSRPAGKDGFVGLLLGCDRGKIWIRESFGWESLGVVGSWTAGFDCCEMTTRVLLTTRLIVRARHSIAVPCSQTVTCPSAWRDAYMEGRYVDRIANVHVRRHNQGSSED